MSAAAVLLAAIGVGHLVGLFAHEVGAFAAWVDERRTDRLAR